MGSANLEGLVFLICEFYRVLLERNKIVYKKIKWYNLGGIIH